MWLRGFRKKLSGLLAPGGDTKKQGKHTHTSQTHTATVLANVRFGIGDTVVAGIGSQIVLRNTMWTFDLGAAVPGDWT